MRRLPVYLVLDVSGSMRGEPIEALRNGVRVLQDCLNTDPYALETAYLSVITFSHVVKQVVPLTDVMSFQAPDLQASGGTSLGAALKLLVNCIDNDVNKGSESEKGDWKPLVILMTDGCSGDDVRPGIEAVKRAKIGTFVACAAGDGADENVLKQITETVVKLDSIDNSTMKSFFKWVSASIAVSSVAVQNGEERNGGMGDLPPPPPVLNVL